MSSPNPTPHEIFMTHLFEEPLVAIGAEPTPDENAALVAALLDYSKRSGPDDFSSLTGFLEKYPTCPWDAALLTNLGLEYYNTGHYSKALEAWGRAWQLAKSATELKGKALADRAVGELAYMQARLGQMAELDALLKSVEGRSFSGPATERITGAREGLSTMQTRPEIAFLCGPLALHRIKLSVDPENPVDELIETYESTQKGCSLRQVEGWAQQLGLNFQMAFREKGAAFVVPSVVHLKLDHYAALVRQEGERYLLEDPTFGNDVWVTTEALEAETSGYFLIPSGELAQGWRTVNNPEGETVWGKGVVSRQNPEHTGRCDEQTPGGNECDDDCKGLATHHVHLMVVSLNIKDEPVGYSTPVGLPIRFMVRYNQRDAFQPSTFNYSNLGPKWTFDWLSYIKDNPNSPSASVEYYIKGGGTRTFTGFDAATQTYTFQKYDQTRLTRTSPTSYEMLSPDGGKQIFSHPDGSIGNSRKIFLTRLIDPFGNAVSLSYDANLRVVAITDAIGQVTTISYDHPTDIHKITRVTDPFGRFATFDYDPSGRLIRITDVIGLTSQFTYDAGDFITTLTTPYGVTSFTKSENGTTRSLETLYPDGYRDRVEFNQSTNLGIPDSDPKQSVPRGMGASNSFLFARNTYYWSKIAFAPSDYTKARVYHWLKATVQPAVASGILESVKEPLEGRVWYDYAGQTSFAVVGSSNKPAHVGRVLDDGSTQLYNYEYNDFGNVTKTMDPLGRTFSYLYAENGIDLLEIRQTRAGHNQLLSRKTYNDQHLPLTSTDAAGQTTTYTYNARGQLLTETNPKGETTIYSYDEDGYLTRVEEALPGASTTYTHDSFGRVRTRTDSDGQTLTFDYDALDRITKVAYSDGTFVQFSYEGLDKTAMRDRAGRTTTYEFNNVRQRIKEIDPLGRVVRYEWCKCGDLKSITDPLGRATRWGHDIQGRKTHKEFPGGARITYRYEQTTSRLRQVIDEKLQVKQYSYNRDDTLSSIIYTNSKITTPHVRFTYDPNHLRLKSVTDGTGTTKYNYHPITPLPTLGAGMIASLGGPTPDNVITYSYDELGRVVSRSVNGSVTNTVFDSLGRIASTTNALGTFAYTYEGGSRRIDSISYPKGLRATFNYGGEIGGRLLERITYRQGATPISDFSYDSDAATGQIKTWSQQAGTKPPKTYSFDYDQADQLVAARLSQAGNASKKFEYKYDEAGNRINTKEGNQTLGARYNALNQLTSDTTEADPGSLATYEWDAEHRLVAVQEKSPSEIRRTEYTYDWQGRRVRIRHTVNGVGDPDRLFVWCDSEICEERRADGRLRKRFFEHGVQLVSHPQSGDYFYTLDHLGSIRELVDDTGGVRNRYEYDPYGIRATMPAEVGGVFEADFGFTGYFLDGRNSSPLSMYRAYAPGWGRWLSRDPLENAEVLQGPNLYAYVRNNPVNLKDPSGLAFCGPCHMGRMFCYGDITTIRGSSIVYKGYYLNPEWFGVCKSVAGTTILWRCLCCSL